MDLLETCKGQEAVVAISWEHFLLDAIPQWIVLGLPEIVVYILTLFTAQSRVVETIASS